jgi:DNA-binding NarL/FixJ family response regulator
MIRLLLVDDQSLICQGLKAMLSLETDLEVIGTADNGEMAIEQVALLKPDVVLMDLRMPVMDGREATRLISKQFPNVKVLVLSTFDDDRYITDSIRAGAKGYLLKDMPSEDLAQAIRVVYRGYTQMGAGLLEKLMANSIPEPDRISEPDRSPELPEAVAQLTPREREVLKLVALGLRNQDIAQQLYVSEGTVKTHVTHLLTRLKLRNRAQLAIYAHSLEKNNH